MSEISATSLIAIALAALWIVVAAAVSIAAARRVRRASAVLASARSMARLLEVTPARPLLVRADGRIDIDPRLLRDLGMTNAPTRLADLAGDECGLDKDDLDALVADVEAAAVACEPVDRKVRAVGSRRVTVTCVVVLAATETSVDPPSFPAIAITRYVPTGRFAIRKLVPSTRPR